MSNSFYVFIESLKSTYQAGGVVMLPILLVGTIGFYYLFSSWFRIGSDFSGCRRRSGGKPAEKKTWNFVSGTPLCYRAGAKESRRIS